MEHRHEFPSELSAVDERSSDLLQTVVAKGRPNEATQVSDQFERSKLGGTTHSITSRTSVCARCGGRDR